MADLLDDSTEENPNVTLGETITMLKGYYSLPQSSNQINLSSNNSIIIWSIIAIVAFCAFGVTFAVKKAKKVR
jgi:hypothetical protein